MSWPQGYSSGPDEAVLPIVPEGPAPGAPRDGLAIDDPKWWTDLLSGIRRLTLRDGDVLVLGLKSHLSPPAIDALKDRVQAAFGIDIPVVVLGDGATLAVVNKSELAR